jgi:hypothetical protein
MSGVLLLQTKCPVIAHDAGVPVGSIVLERGRGTGRARARMVGRMYTIGGESQQGLRPGAWWWVEVD